MAGDEYFRLRDLFRLLDLALKRQGTLIDASIAEDRSRWIPQEEICKEFAVDPADAEEFIKELVEYVSVGGDDLLGLLRYAFEDGKFYLGFLFADLPRPLVSRRLTAREALALKVALRTWSRLATSRSQAALSAMMSKLSDKIDGCMTPVTKAQAGDTDKAMHIEVPEEEASVVRALEDAINSRRALSFKYADPAIGHIKEREVEPRSVFYTKSRWYLLGWCRASRDVRTFYLDGISGLKVLDSPFRFPELEADEDILAADPLEGAETPIKVRLKFLPPLSRWVEERSDPSCIRHQKDGSVVSTIHVRSVEGMKKTLLQFGDKVRVLEPKELREGLAEKARAMLKMYEGAD